MNLATTIGLPALLTGVLMQVFQFLKVYVLAPYVPGFKATDPSSNGNLRIVFYVLTLAMLVADVLSGAAGISIPVDLGGRLVLAYALLNSAGVLTAAAHITYATGMSKGSGSADPAYPPGLSAAELGLPISPSTPVASVAPAVTPATPIADAAPSAPPAAS